MKRIIITATIILSAGILSTSCIKKINLKQGAITYYESVGNDRKDIASAD